jgi:hypothetical protein
VEFDDFGPYSLGCPNELGRMDTSLNEGQYVRTKPFSVAENIICQRLKVWEK